jgi:hypothetical protein
MNPGNFSCIVLPSSIPGFVRNGWLLRCTGNASAAMTGSHGTVVRFMPQISSPGIIQRLLANPAGAVG